MITISLAMGCSVMALVWSAACTAAGVVLWRQQKKLRARCEAADAALAELQREWQLSAVRRTERSEPVEARSTLPSFDRAIEFARRGGDVAQLVQRFGMSRGEAELTVRMHGAKRSA